RSALQEDWGITPEQVVDLQAMVGDSVDNVPGVPKVGIKTAAKLLQEHGSLDNILAALEREDLTGMLARPAIRDRFRASKEAGERSRQLVRLARDVPLQMEWELWKLGDWDGPRLLALFQRWGFHRFADQVRVTVRKTEREPAMKQATLFPIDVENGQSEGEA